MPVRKVHVRFAGLCALLAALVGLGLATDPTQLLSLDGLRELARRHPWQAAGTFLVAGIGLKLMFVPFNPLSVAGGLVFGGGLGGTLASCALMLSSLIVFGLGRGLGRGWMAEAVQDGDGWLGRIERLLREHGLLAVVVLRVVPTLPLSAVNVLLGQSSVRWSSFVLGSLLGIVPGAYLLAFVGDAALEPGAPRFWFFLSLAGATILGGVLLGYRLERRTTG